MRIGIIKETKVPEDNRVALSPQEIVDLQQKFPDVEFVVQKSDIRVYSDEEYALKGIRLVDHVDDCDVLFGIKEADIESLIPNKHYFFFGHIAKMQPYNKPLLKRMMELNITFSDYEYLVDEKGYRLCAFGWWAGVVGVYNTLRAYGLRMRTFELPKPDKQFTLIRMQSEVKVVELPALKIIVTGNGRVSHGAQHFLDEVGIKQVSPREFLEQEFEFPVYTEAKLPDTVCRIDDESIFDREEFHSHPELYKSNFLRFAKVTDIFIPCHYWGPEDPIYLGKENLRNPEVKIKIIGDVTCDIMGSVQSTLRPSTHKDPFYDYNPCTEMEEIAFSSESNVTVMAVDTLPNALALDTSDYFGKALVKHVINDMLRGNTDESDVINRATILKNGKLTERFAYLRDYAYSE